MFSGSWTASSQGSESCHPVDQPASLLFQGWLLVDYICDAIYLLDLLVRMHEGYLDQGIMVKEAAMLRKNYRKSKFFKVDIVSILPTDFAYFFFEGKCSEQVPNHCCPLSLSLVT